ncbi:MAG: hypothetical protein U5L45_14905 [Saprospiraceae bacterium]|nr:hypothetical protein [Saprospiraceae bacterium]
MVRFSGFARKTNHIPLFCERSEREMQKTLLGYAHPSTTYIQVERKKIIIICKLLENSNLTVRNVRGTLKVPRTWG